MDKRQLVYKIISYIPKGKVLTYRRLAVLASLTSVRYVGRLMHQNPDPKRVPCHRVVGSKGQLAKEYAFGGAKIQRAKLVAEGVKFKNNNANVSIHGWKPTKIFKLYFQLLRKYGVAGS